MKKKLIIFGSILIILLVSSLYFIPYFTPITIIDIRTGCTYKVYEDHATFYKAKGVKRDTLEIADEILGRKVTGIEEYAFSEDECEIETIIVSDTVKVIEPFAFVRNDAVKTVVLGDNTRVLRPYAFDTCNNLVTVELNQGLEVIDEYVFSNCEKLENVTIPDSVQYIGRRAFLKTAMSEFIIPKNLNDIGDCVMADTPWEVDKGKEVINQGYFVSEYTERKVVLIPQNVKYVAAEFYFTAREIYIPEGVEVLGNCLVYNNSSKTDCTFYIPSSVTRISTGDMYGEDCIPEIVSDLSKAKIVTTEGSYAEQYAIEKGIAYEIVDDVQTLYDAALERQKAGQE